MPHYALEILEADGSSSTGEHDSPDGVWYDTGHRFDHDGRTLRVRLLEESHAGFDQKLICAPE